MNPEKLKSSNPAEVGQYPSLYRATVLVRKDPEGQHRIKVNCPQIYGDITPNDLPWAYPKFPAWADKSGQYGGGGFVCVPPIGAPVYIQFEGGNPLYPVYEGGWFPRTNHPDFRIPDHSIDKKGNPDNHYMTTPRGTTIQLDDREGEEKVLVRLPEGDYLAITAGGLTELRPKLHVNIKTEKLIEVQCENRVEVKAKTVGVYGSEKVDVVSDGDIDIKAKGNVNIDGSAIFLNSGTSDPLFPKEVRDIDNSNTQDGNFTVQSDQ